MFAAYAQIAPATRPLLAPGVLVCLVKIRLNFRVARKHQPVETLRDLFGIFRHGRCRRFHHLDRPLAQHRTTTSTSIVRKAANSPAWKHRIPLPPAFRTITGCILHVKM